jgi:hypothetical protein
MRMVDEVDILLKRCAKELFLGETSIAEDIVVHGPASSTAGDGILYHFEQVFR